MGRDDSIHATRRRRLLAAGLCVGFLVAVGCATKGGTTSTPSPTPPTPGKFGPSSIVIQTPPTVSLPTYGPTTTRGRTIG